MKIADMSLVSFTPGTFILIDDVFTGIRKLAEVLPGGIQYRDLSDQVKGHPFPIYKALNPEDVGNVFSWAARAADTDQRTVFDALHTKLLDDGIDPMTVARALHWALESGNYAYMEALAAGQMQTELVTQSRDRLHAQAKRGLTIAANTYSEIFM